MTKLKLQVLIIPITHAGDPTNKIDPLKCKRFLHLADPSIELNDVKKQVEERYKKLYPNEDSLEIEGFQDNNLCDLDPDYCLSDVFQSGDVLRITVSNEMKSRGASPLSTSIHTTPVAHNAPILTTGSDFASSRKRTQEYFEKVDTHLPVKHSKPNSPVSSPIRRDQVSSPVALSPPPVVENRRIPRKKKLAGVVYPSSPSKSSDVGSKRITSGMLTMPPHAQMEKEIIRRGRGRPRKDGSAPRPTGKLRTADSDFSISEESSSSEEEEDMEDALEMALDYSEREDSFIVSDDSGSNEESSQSGSEEEPNQNESISERSLSPESVEETTPAPVELPPSPKKSQNSALKETTRRLKRGEETVSKNDVLNMFKSKLPTKGERQKPKPKPLPTQFRDAKAKATLRALSIDMVDADVDFSLGRGSRRAAAPTSLVDVDGDKRTTRQADQQDDSKTREPGRPSKRAVNPPSPKKKSTSDKKSITGDPVPSPDKLTTKTEKKLPLSKEAREDDSMPVETGYHLIANQDDGKLAKLSNRLKVFEQTLKSLQGEEEGTLKKMPENFVSGVDEEMNDYQNLILDSRLILASRDNRKYNYPIEFIPHESMTPQSRHSPVLSNMSSPENSTHVSASADTNNGSTKPPQNQVHSKPSGNSGPMQAAAENEQSKPISNHVTVVENNAREDVDEVGEIEAASERDSEVREQTKNQEEKTKQDSERATQQKDDFSVFLTAPSLFIDSSDDESNGVISNDIAQDLNTNSKEETDVSEKSITRIGNDAEKEAQKNSSLLTPQPEEAIESNAADKEVLASEGFESADSTIGEKSQNNPIDTSEVIEISSSDDEEDGVSDAQETSVPLPHTNNKMVTPPVAVGVSERNPIVNKSANSSKQSSPVAKLTPPTQAGSSISASKSPPSAPENVSSLVNLALNDSSIPDIFKLRRSNSSPLNVFGGPSPQQKPLPKASLLVENSRLYSPTSSKSPKNRDTTAKSPNRPEKSPILNNKGKAQSASVVEGPSKVDPGSFFSKPLIKDVSPPKATSLARKLFSHFASSVTGSSNPAPSASNKAAFDINSDKAVAQPQRARDLSNARKISLVRKRGSNDSSSGESSEEDVSSSESEVEEGNKIKKPRLIASVPSTIRRSQSPVFTSATPPPPLSNTLQQQIVAAAAASAPPKPIASISSVTSRLFPPIPTTPGSADNANGKASEDPRPSNPPSTLKTPLLNSLTDLANRGLPEVRDVDAGSKSGPVEKTDATKKDDESSSEEESDSDSDDDSDLDDEEDHGKFLSLKLVKKNEPKKKKLNLFSSLVR